MSQQPPAQPAQSYGLGAPQAERLQADYFRRSYSRAWSDTTDRQILTVTFDKGVDESQEAESLAPGFLAYSENLVPEPTGILRARPGFIAGTNSVGNLGPNSEGETGIYPTTRQVRGMTWAPAMSAAGNDKIVVGMQNALGTVEDATKKAQIWATADDYSGNWQFVDSYTSGVDFDGTIPDFAKGIASLLWTHPAFATNLRRWSGDVPATIAVIGASAGTMDCGRAIAFHKDYFFMGGGNLFPARLYRSGKDNGSSWNMDASTGDWQDIGADDNLPIEDIVEFQGDLIVAKKNRVYIISAATTTTPQTTELPGAYGSKGRCLIVTPMGLVILGDKEAWLWRGGVPRLISPAVWTDYAAGAGDWRVGDYAGGWVFIAQHKAGAKDLAFDMQNGVWYVLSVGAEAERPDCFLGIGSRMHAGMHASTLGTGPTMYVDLPNGPRVKDASTISTVFTASTPIISPGSNARNFTLRSVAVKVRQRGTGSNPHLTITPYVDGAVLAAFDIPPFGAAGVYNVAKNYGDGGNPRSVLQFVVSYTVPSGGGVLWDVDSIEAEIDILAPQT